MYMWACNKFYSCNICVKVNRNIVNEMNFPAQHMQAKHDAYIGMLDIYLHDNTVSSTSAVKLEIQSYVCTLRCYSGKQVSSAILASLCKTSSLLLTDNFVCAIHKFDQYTKQLCDLRHVIFIIDHLDFVDWNLK